MHHSQNCQFWAGSAMFTGGGGGRKAAAHPATHGHLASTHRGTETRSSCLFLAWLQVFSSSSFLFFFPGRKRQPSFCRASPAPCQACILHVPAPCRTASVPLSATYHRMTNGKLFCGLLLLCQPFFPPSLLPHFRWKQPCLPTIKTYTRCSDKTPNCNVGTPDTAGKEGD